jgi:hypothetical protein
MPSPLFSTYRGGENRVTSSLIAVLERIEQPLVERLLGTIAEESSLSMVSFENQFTSAADTVPDAAISANFRYLVEVKIVENSVRSDQIRGHLRHLTGTHADERLFVLTPENNRPRALDEFADDARIVWSNFRRISAAIGDILGDPTELIGERTTFLLRELQALFRAEGLVDPSDTVVVAARSAYPEYLACGVYVCQPNRSFQPVGYFGFYADGEIKPEIALIEHVEDSVEFSADEADRRRALGTPSDVRIGGLIAVLLERGRRTAGQSYKLFLLSPADDPRTNRLAHPIVNATVASSGRPWAWTLGQRYTNLDKLLQAPPTTEGLR